jgi:hypothetical protein
MPLPRMLAQRNEASLHAYNCRTWARSSAGEQRLCKPKVPGSIPGGSTSCVHSSEVERRLDVSDAAGSIPAGRTYQMGL